MGVFTACSGRPKLSTILSADGASTFTASLCSTSTNLAVSKPISPLVTKNPIWLFKIIKAYRFDI